eukprot:1139293-Pelagomonas_calceolata.AAC.13
MHWPQRLESFNPNAARSSLVLFLPSPRLSGLGFSQPQTLNHKDDRLKALNDIQARLSCRAPGVQQDKAFNASGVHDHNTTVAKALHDIQARLNC